MDKEELENNENPQAGVEERESDTLLSLIKEATELSRISATVNMAYIKAKSADKVKAGYHEISTAIDDKIKATVGNIKENSKLYDETKEKKANVCQRYGDILEAVSDHYDKRIEDLLAKRASLESQNMSLVADNQNLKLDKKDREKEYKRDEKAQKSDDIAKIISEKKAEAEKLAKSGDLEGAQATIEEYKKLKESQVQETTSGMIEIASIAQQIKLNSAQYKNNKQTIKDIDAEIERLEAEKEKKLDTVCKIQDKELTKIDEKTSVFKKIAMFASNAITKTFNKGKAINNQVLVPMKNKIEVQLPIIEESIGTKISSIKENVKTSFKDKLNRAMEFGRNVREGAISKLRERNDKKRENLQNKAQYLDDREGK